MKSNGFVREMRLAIPFATVFQEGQVYYLCIGSAQPQVLMTRQAPSPKSVELFKTIFVSRYQNKGHARAVFDGNPDHHAHAWVLYAVPASEYLDHGGVFVHSDMGVPAEMLLGHSISPLLGDWFAAWRNRYPNIALWAAPGATDSSGRLTLDALLSIALPEDYQPVRVMEFTLRPHDDPDNTPRFGHWFDVAIGPGVEESSDLSGWGSVGRGVTDKLVIGPKETVKGHCGWSCSSWEAISPSEAVAKLMRQHPTLVAAVELPEAPQPPNGYVRWYDIREKPGTNTD
ncbi:MAG: hypothetical protein EON54_19630 [Alcaligenaceae bacterium]|nr:MAG: hypothetical protein EON54_19630 [Alcaligenaceae bacterium]